MTCTMHSWDSLVEWAGHSLKRKAPSHIIYKMCLVETIYSIWNEMNAQTFRNEFKPKEKVLQEICNLMSFQI